MNACGNVRRGVQLLLHLDSQQGLYARWRLRGLCQSSRMQYAGQVDICRVETNSDAHCYLDVYALPCSFQVELRLTGRTLAEPVSHAKPFAIVGNILAIMVGSGDESSRVRK